MAAPPKVSTQAIVNAMLLWRGDVSAVARCLGLSRNGLYQRIQRLGLDIAGFRNAGGGNAVIPINVDTSVSTVPTMPTEPGRQVHAHSIPKTSRANFPGGGGGRKVRTVSQGSTATAAPEDVPIKTAPQRRLSPLRLRPDLRERLQRAAWQLQARYEVATDENLILEQLVEETLAAWVATKIERPTAVGKARATKKGGTE
jgi:hypothetical protein